MHIFLTLIFFSSLFATPSRIQDLEMPARKHWIANDGYCGETSFIAAGIYYGQYMSQYMARSLALNGGAQTDGELLLGDNAMQAARAMHLHVAEWPGGTSAEFLDWARQHILAGRPVIIGVYANQYRFYGTTDPTAGDPDYDHIVPAFGIASGPTKKAIGYYDDDVLAFSDNGLWAPKNKPPYIFREPFAEFQASRTTANAPDSPIYTLPNDTRNYGIAILGIADAFGDTLPIRLQVTPNDEAPPIDDGSNTPPAASTLTIRVLVSNLRPDKRYILYRYNDPASVPEDRFNAHGSQALSARQFQIKQGTTWQIEETIPSNEPAIYRAVLLTAP
jgi:hypothetical protein